MSKDKTIKQAKLELYSLLLNSDLDEDIDAENIELMYLLSKDSQIQNTISDKIMEEAIVNTGYKVSRNSDVMDYLIRDEEEEPIKAEFTLEDKEWIDKIDGSKLTSKDIL